MTCVSENVNNVVVRRAPPPAFDLITERMEVADVHNTLNTRYKCVSRDSYSLTKVEKRLCDLHLVFHFASFVVSSFI